MELSLSKLWEIVKDIVSSILMKGIHIIQDFIITGIADTGRCGCGVQLGGVAAPGFCSERPILGCDVGEL